jgi:hypothetical protein
MDGDKRSAQVERLEVVETGRRRWCIPPAKAALPEMM